MTKLAYGLIGGFFAFLLTFGAGAWVGHKVVKSEWDTSEAQIGQAAEARVAAVSAFATGLSVQLEGVKSRAGSTLDENLQEIPHATSVFKSSPVAAPEPLPDYRFTVDAVCLWDAANSIPVPGTPLRPDGSPDCSQAPDALALTDITPADALANEQYNGAAFTVCRAELSGLQEFVAKAESGQPRP